MGGCTASQWDCLHPHSIFTCRLTLLLKACKPHISLVIISYVCTHDVHMALFWLYAASSLNKRPWSQLCDANTQMAFSVITLIFMNLCIPGLASAQCFCVWYPVPARDVGLKKATPLAIRVQWALPTLKESFEISHLNYPCRNSLSGICCPPARGLCLHK